MRAALGVGLFFALLVSGCNSDSGGANRGATTSTGGASGSSAILTAGGSLAAQGGATVGGADATSASGGMASVGGNSAGGAQGGDSSIAGSVGALPDASTTVSGTLPMSTQVATALLSDPVATCQGWALETESEQSVILFLVDVSGSLRNTSPTSGGQTKWEVTRTALKTAIGTIAATSSVGLSFFPNMAISIETASSRPASACVNTAKDAPLAPATAAQQAKALAALDGTEPISTGATPTHDALNLALEQLKNTTLPGKRYLVLITDGQPTQSLGCLGTGMMCNPAPTAPIIDAIAQAYSDNGIRTFVVGSSGSEKNECTGADVRGWLSQAARAGNTATVGCSDTAAPYCHFDLSEAADLGTALTDALNGTLSGITGSSTSCSIEVPQPLDGTVLEPARVNLILATDTKYLLLLPNKIGPCDKGWSYTDTTYGRIQICGATCDLVADNPAAKLNILYGCKRDTSLTQ